MLMWKICIIYAKKSKMDALLVQNKVSFAGYVKNESVALFPGQLQAKFPWKEANTQFFTYFF